MEVGSKTGPHSRTSREPDCSAHKQQSKQPALETTSAGKGRQQAALPSDNSVKGQQATLPAICISQRQQLPSIPSSGTWSSSGPTQPTGCIILSLSARIWSTHSFGGRKGSTCPKECRLHLSAPLSLSLRMRAWWGGGHCIVPGSGTLLYSNRWTRDERQLHINV